MKRPKWTVLYNIVSGGSNWIGTGWEFFDSENIARERYRELEYRDFSITMRPYHPNDEKHLGAVHRT